MLLDHIHFNVHNANITGDWFIEKMGFQPVSQFINNQTLTRILTQNNSIFFFISSALNISSPVYNYLNSFASGVVDVAFKVKNIDAILNNLSTLENQILNTPYTYIFPEGKLKIAKIKGWNSLEHTLIENNTNIPFAYLIAHLPINNKSLNIENNLHCQSQLITNNNYNFTKIDHLVLIKCSNFF